ncbi:MAG: hypothetical protein O7E52_01240 [Candidatus Poribacteria bacterium]|nr:hypothetical protein [Candidatus Poribacteria bacterium]
MEPPPVGPYPSVTLQPEPEVPATPFAEVHQRCTAEFLVAQKDDHAAVINQRLNHFQQCCLLPEAGAALAREHHPTHREGPATVGEPDSAQRMIFSPRLSARWTFLRSGGESM